MVIEEQAADLRKQIEKLKRELIDDTALTAKQRTAKENKLATLQQQFVVLEVQLPELEIKKVVHQ